MAKSRYEEMVNLIDISKRQFLLIQNACYNGQIEMGRKQKTLIQDCLTTHATKFAINTEVNNTEEEQVTLSND